MSASVSWFEIPANDPQKLTEFYKAACGWGAEQFGDMPYFTLDTKIEGGNSGIHGAVTQRGPLQAPAVTLSVPSLDDAISRVTKNGGRAVSDKVTIPGVGTYLYAADPEGNVFGLLQPAAA